MVLNSCKRNPIGSMLGQLYGMLVINWRNTVGAVRWLVVHSNCSVMMVSLYSSRLLPTVPEWHLVCCVRVRCVTFNATGLCGVSMQGLTSVAFFSACSSFSWASFSDSEYLSSSSSTPFSFFCRPSSSSSSYRTSAPMKYKYTETEHLRKCNKNIYEELRESWFSFLISIIFLSVFRELAIYSRPYHREGFTFCSALSSKNMNSGIGDNTLKT